MTQLDTAELESAIRESLRDVIDPEIGMNVIDLGLIRNIEFDQNETRVTMILTTPFCPLAGWIMEQVRQKTEEVVKQPVRVNLGDELWDPSMMEVDPWGLI